MEYYRHGDVTLEVIPQIPEGFKKLSLKRIVLALGEVTGHSHSVIPIGEETELSVYTVDGNKPDATLNDICFEVKGGKALLIHEEHEPIILEPGIHNRKMKVQFNPFTNAIENVRD